MSELLDIIIQAVDNASGVFDSITGAAESMADTITGGAVDTETAFEAATQRVDELSETLAGIYMGDIEGDADAVEQELAEATAEAQRLGQELANADTEIEEMGSDLDIINSSMLLQLGEQVGQLGTQAEGMAQDMNTASISVGQLATQTGVAEPQMVSLINTISNATFPNEEAMMYVKALDQMGVSTQNFGKSATDMDRINDALGLGAPKVTALANEMSVLGVDMNNVSSSFNALAYANSNTIGGMQNYQTFLTKYSADFAELGLNIDQASVIISGATQKFGGGRAALTGLSRALKDANGDTKALEEALDLESGSIENATQITGQYEGQLQDLANEEAEHKTLTDQLGAAWEDLSLSLSPVLEPLSSIIGLIGAVGSFGLQISGLKTLVSIVREFNAVQTITNLLEGESVIARAASAIGITTEAAAAEGATIAFGGLAIAEGAALWPILAIAAAIAALIIVVYEVGKAFGWWTDVGSMIDAIWAGIQRLWSAFINHPDVQAVLGVLTEAWNQLTEAIGWAWNELLKFFGIATGGEFDIVRALIDGIGWAWNGLKAAMAPIVSAVMSVINVFNQFRTGQMDLPTFIITILNMVMNAYMSIFNQIVGLVVKFGSQMIQRGVSAARSFVNGIINRIKQLPGQVWNYLSNVVQRIIRAGESWYNNAVKAAGKILKGAKDGLKGIADTITSALSGVKSALTKPFDDAWAIIKPVYDKIKGGIDAINNAGAWLTGSAGFELETTDTNGNNFNINTGEYTSNTDNTPIKVEYDVNLNLDLINVPTHINTRDLINGLKDKTVIESLTGNKDFQDADMKVKSRIRSRTSRQKGV